MKSKFSKLFAALSLSFIGLGGTSMVSAASAQDTVILIVNQAQIFGQSKAGQSMVPQLQKLQEVYNSELNAEVEKIVKESEDLQKQKGLMSEDVWTEQAKKVAVKQNNLPVLREVKVRELQISENQARGKITESLLPILEKIVKARGATLLLDRSAVMYAATDNDITAEVIAELDKKLQSVKVEKVDLAELQKKAQAEAQSRNKK